MLRVKVRVERADGKASSERLAIVNSGFIGVEPELLVTSPLCEELKLSEMSSPEELRRVLADGSEALLERYRGALTVSVICEDYESGRVEASALVSRSAKHVLINDKLAGRLGFVILDLGEGLWCFRHELGVRVRRSL